MLLFKLVSDHMHQRMGKFVEDIDVRQYYEQCIDGSKGQKIFTELKMIFMVLSFQICWVNA